jgi:hypothetical protein
VGRLTSDIATRVAMPTTNPVDAQLWVHSKRQLTVAPLSAGPPGSGKGTQSPKIKVRIPFTSHLVSCSVQWREGGISHGWRWPDTPQLRSHCMRIGRATEQCLVSSLHGPRAAPLEPRQHALVERCPQMRPYHIAAAVEVRVRLLLTARSPSVGTLTQPFRLRVKRALRLLTMRNTSLIVGIAH